MGLIEQEIKELRQMNKDIMEGKIAKDMVDARIAIYSQTEKRAKMMVQVFALAAKHKTHLNRIVRSNLIGDDEAIDTTTAEIEAETVKCPGKDGSLITRAECLDFSGSDHFPECRGCVNGIKTRERLLG